MTNIVCQNADQRCIYALQTSYAKLRENVVADFSDLSEHFDLMYIDQIEGDWMLVNDQSDFNRILMLNKSHILIKVLPTIRREQQQVKKDQGKVKKLVITQQLQKLVEFVSQKHLQKYFSKRMAQKMMEVSQIMLEQKIPPSRTKFTSIDPSIQKRLMDERPSRRITRLSPQKSTIQLKIEDAVNLKLSNLVGQLIDKSLAATDKMMCCKCCLKKQLEMERLISDALRRKSRNRGDNPEQW